MWQKKKNNTIEFRHYKIVIGTKYENNDKNVKNLNKLLNNNDGNGKNIPNLSKLNDISELITNKNVNINNYDTSDTENEDNKIKLPQSVNPG